MTYTSIFEKILFIYNLVSASWIYIAFASLALLLIILLLFKKISKKTCFILITLATKLVLGYTIYIYYEPISKLINDIVDNIFLNIYFPSAYAYLFVLLVINIVSIGNLLAPKGEKGYKIVNGICFIVTNFILALVLEIIAKDKVDVFAKESLYTNTSLVTLLEIGIIVFICWLLSLLVVYIINNITERIMISHKNKNIELIPITAVNTELSINDKDLKEEYQTVPTTTASINVPNPVLENPTQELAKVQIISTPIMHTSAPMQFIPNIINSPSIVGESVQNKFIPNINVVVEETKIKTENATTNLENTFDLSAFIPLKQDVRPISTLNNNQIFEQILKNELPVIPVTKEEMPMP